MWRRSTKSWPRTTAWNWTRSEKARKLVIDSAVVGGPEEPAVEAGPAAAEQQPAEEKKPARKRVKKSEESAPEEKDSE